MSAMLFALIFPREQRASTSVTFPLNEMYGYSRLCDRLRSSAIIWKQVSLRSSAIYDLRSAIVCDRLRSYGNQPLNVILARFDLKPWEEIVTWEKQHEYNLSAT